MLMNLYSNFRFYARISYMYAKTKVQKIAKTR